MKLKFFLLACGALCLLITACSKGYGTDSTLQKNSPVTFVQIAHGELYGNGNEGIAKQNLAIASQEELMRFYQTFLT
jgi:hypothetical protein